LRKEKENAFHVGHPDEFKRISLEEDGEFALRLN
jgi:hypothetical protein